LRKPDVAGGTIQPGKGAGGYALAEILSQPQCWRSCLTLLDQDGLMRKLTEPLKLAQELLFVGCGSSYYIALAAAASWSAITGMRARAIPASEVLLFPDLALASLQHPAAVVISRSGRTSEALQAAEILECKNGIPTLAITCAAEQPLAQAVTQSLALLPAVEESTVMTRSFTSMLIGLQYLAAWVAGDQRLMEGLRGLPARTEPWLGNLHLRIRQFVAANHFADYVCLGQGPFYGLACESTLKLTEMSVSYGQSFHTLEFRHGPKSIVGPETLIVFFLSERGYDAESDVLEEIKLLGGTTIAIADRADERVRKFADLAVDLELGGSEISRMVAYVIPAQLLGLYTGLKKGLDPDHPRHLSQVVLLEEDNSE
jgi:glucosamine--fructose-6-phosphate aminotransferase (isomerizing)